jgi:hypothetical protein
MSTRDAFERNMETKVASAQADLERFTILGMGFTAAAKDKHNDLVEELEQKIDETKNKLRELTRAKRAGLTRAERWSNDELGSFTFGSS